MINNHWLKECFKDSLYRNCMDTTHTFVEVEEVTSRSLWYTPKRNHRVFLYVAKRPRRDKMSVSVLICPLVERHNYQ